MLMGLRGERENYANGQEIPMFADTKAGTISRFLTAN